MSNGSDSGFPGKPESTNTSTRVDLGEDLLQTRSGVETNPRNSFAPVSSDTDPGETIVDEIGDKLESARILLNEGLLEEGKKVLRKILIQDPHNVVARKRLEEVHEKELQQIFGDSAPRRPTLGATKADTEVTRSFDTDQLIQNLDLDLQLGLGDLRPSLFHSDEPALTGPLPKWDLKLDEHLSGLSSKDRLDVGIAFLEMGFYKQASAQFQFVLNDLTYRIQGACLFAFSKILEKEPFEASLVLEPLLNESDIPAKEKLEILYLSARASEALDQKTQAIGKYLQICKLEAGYRDTEDRLKYLYQQWPKQN